MYREHRHPACASQSVHTRDPFRQSRSRKSGQHCTRELFFWVVHMNIYTDIHTQHAHVCLTCSLHSALYEMRVYTRVVFGQLLIYRKRGSKSTRTRRGKLSRERLSVCAWSNNAVLLGRLRLMSEGCAASGSFACVFVQCAIQSYHIYGGYW